MTLTIHMGINNIQSTYTFAFSAPYIDSEEKEIMARLLAYGITPTGNKATDRATLKRVETEKAKQENIVSANKFLTVSIAEQEQIQDKKKEKRKGAQILSDYNKMFLVKYQKGNF